MGTLHIFFYTFSGQHGRLRWDIASKYIEDDRQTCKICGHKFAQFTNLKRHVVLHNRISAGSRLKDYICEDGLTCSLCGHTGSTEPMVIRHIGTHVVNDVQDFACPYCDARLVSSSGLHGHIRHSHPGHGP